MSAAEKTEVAVIGAGPGGYACAFRAADLGKKTVLIERYPDLGGVCLNVGCIPSKALLHVARLIDEIRAFKQHGIDLGTPRIETEPLRSWTEGVVRRLTGGLKTLARQRRVTVLHGTAAFRSPHELRVTGAPGDQPGGEQTVSFEHAVIAAGSQAARIPGLPEDPRVLDSTAALRLASIPKRLLVIGGGVIGLEMACLYDALGSEITVVELTDRLLADCDPDIVKPLEGRLRERYTGVHLATRVLAVEAHVSDMGRGELSARLEGQAGPFTQGFDAVLCAVGRRPNGHRLGAEHAGISVSEAGYIPIDAQMRTNVPHIFAIGDIARPPLLAHKAAHEGRVAAEVIAGHKSGFEGRVVPSVAYTDPEIAWVGLTETEAVAQGVRFGKGVFPWAANGRALSYNRGEGLTKLLFDESDHRLLGMAACGPNAGDLIAEGTLAIEMGCDARDIALTIHPHPTLSETVGQAAEVFEGTVTDLYLPRR
ncbi:MAG: dihydrolipoyl dehydrogenase [Pseudomonadota bacterium]|nr:dihydrolipoyl dehydrogenase [Pseudomonadota bacterium]